MMAKNEKRIEITQHTMQYVQQTPSYNMNTLMKL